ncbi:monocarboxylate transporter 12 [Aplysia californica]|uniref:Monocarboxylate transporter 12 n=1 Tax=Aplysia californica TaxID=6500 RepID=A0ABM0JLF6_APLCA|nr:monocarboxylate transporter 12 [Aplysia californica]
MLCIMGTDREEENNRPADISDALTWENHTMLEDTQAPGPAALTRKLPELPVDRGWAWFVMLGAFTTTMCLMTVIRSMALLLMEFLELYQASATMTTLAFGLSAAMVALSNLLLPIFFLPRFTIRTIALSGAVANALALLVIAFSPSIYLTDAMFAVTGFSFGLMIAPQMALLGCYFKRRLSLATATAGLGLSVATIGGPPFTQALLDYYGLWGTVMLLAGLNLHCIPATMLFRPTSMYAAPAASNLNAKSISSSIPPTSSDVDTKSPTLPCVPSEHHAIDISKEQRKSVNNTGILIETEKVGEDRLSEKECIKYIFNKDSEKRISISENRRKASLSCSFLNEEKNGRGIQNFLYETNVHKLSLRNKKTSASTSVIDKICQSSFVQYISAPSLGVLAANQSSGQQNDSKQSQILCSLPAIPHGPVDVQLNGDNDEEAPLSCIQKLKQTKTFSVYSSPLAIILILASGLGVHTQAVYGYMPVIGAENGLAIGQTAVLLTVTGTCDLLSKLAIGALADFPCVNRMLVGVVCQMGIGVLMQFMDFFNSFPLMISVQVAAGLTVDTFYVLLPVIIADVLGPDYIGHILSAFFLINGFITSMDHLVAGWLKDTTGSFRGVYHYMGVLFIATGLILASEPLVKRMKARSRKTSYVSDAS